MEDDEIERLAREEILEEAKRAAERAEYVGPQGWMKCTVPPANKRFLRNTLMQTIGKNSRVAGCNRDAESKKPTATTESQKATTSARTDVTKSSSKKTRNTRTDAEKSSTNSRSVTKGHLGKRLKTGGDDSTSLSKRKVEENSFRKVKESDKRILFL